jgi:hypothetical protein
MDEEGDVWRYYTNCNFMSWVIYCDKDNKYAFSISHTVAQTS